MPVAEEVVEEAVEVAEFHYSATRDRVPVCKSRVRPEQVTGSVREAWGLVDCEFCRGVLDRQDAEVAAWLDGWRQVWKETHG